MMNIIGEGVSMKKAIAFIVSFCAAFAAGVSLAAVSGGEDLIQDAVEAQSASIKASSEATTAFAAQNLIDGKVSDTGARWISDTAIDQTVTFGFERGFVQIKGAAVTAYEIFNVGVGQRSGTDSAWGRTPCSWVFQGCNFNSANDADWVTLDTRSDVDWSAAKDIDENVPFSKTFTLESRASYSYYRLKFSKRCGGTTSSYAYQLTELKFWGVASDKDRIDITAAARSASALSATATSGVMAGTVTYGAKNLIDGSYAMLSRWISDNRLSQSATISVDSKFRRGYGIVVTAYALNSIGTNIAWPNSSAGRMPSSWTFEGCDTLSANDADWTTLDTRENVDWSAYKDVAENATFGRSFSFENTRSFRHYRFKFTDRYGGSSFENYAYQLVEVQLFGRVRIVPEVDLNILDDFRERKVGLVTATSAADDGTMVGKLIDGKFTASDCWVSDGNLSQTIAVSIGTALYPNQDVALKSYVFHSVGLGSGGADSAASRMPSAWKLQGCDTESADDADWTTVDEKTNEDWSEFASVAAGTAFSRTFTLAEPAHYRFYRFVLAARYGGETTGSAYQLAELEMVASIADKPGQTGKFGNFLRAADVTFPSAQSVEDMPVLLRLSAEKPAGFRPAEAGANGETLRFVDEAGRLLAHDIESWDAEGTSFVWVNMPSLSSSTKITMLWGACGSGLIPAARPAGEAWGAYQEGWHMNGRAAAFGHAETSVAATGAADALLGPCYHLDAAQVSVVRVPKGLTDGVSSFTLSAWFRPDASFTASTPTKRLISGMAASSGYGFDSFFFVEQNTRKIGLRGYATPSASPYQTPVPLGTSDLTANRWTQLTIVWDGDTCSTYIDGQVVAAAKPLLGGPANAGYTPIWGLGNLGGDGATQSMAFPGFVDEFRVYPGVATSRRVAMSYASVADPDFAVFSEVRHVAKGLALILK